jgi:hypothetical protein
MPRILVTNTYVLEEPAAFLKMEEGGVRFRHWFLPDCTAPHPGNRDLNFCSEPRKSCSYICDMSSPEYIINIIFEQPVAFNNIL